LPHKNYPFKRSAFTNFVHANVAYSK